MPQDVEMKEQQAPAAPSNSISSTAPSVLQYLKEIAVLIETGAYAREVRRILRAVRLTIALRRKLKASMVSSFLNFALAPGSEALSRLSSYLPKGMRSTIRGYGQNHKGCVSPSTLKELHPRSIRHGDSVVTSNVRERRYVVTGNRI